MKSLSGRNNVKVYKLSAGRSLPDWLTERKRRKLAKRDVDIQRKIELIQDFDMPDVSNCVKVSPDGQYILATGTYKPRVKCFEVSALSLKFERCFDSEVIDLEIISDDYSKIAFLQDERYIEFHYQGGRWFRTRIPKFGRDLAYHYPSCDLYIAASGNEIYRLNLQQGQFLNPIQINSRSANKCVLNPVHYLLTCGTEDGIVEAWDPRARHRVGILDCAIHMLNDDLLPSYKSCKSLGITSLAYKDALTLAVGTQTGQILLYDIRSMKPTLVKDHYDDFPIKDLSFHNSSNNVMSLSSNALKIWDQNTGKPHTSIEDESGVKFNSLCSVPDSGLVFLATEAPKMQIYFLPSLGAAPKWCGHLDSLIEELEEEYSAEIYDDYRFVTLNELQQLGLDSLIGTNVLRAVMHGYYVDVRLYNKARLASNMVDRDTLLKKKVRSKVTAENQRNIKPESRIDMKKPEVNAETFNRVKENLKSTGEKVVLAKSLLKDSRFANFFRDSRFEFDKESQIFELTQPLSGKMSERFKQLESDAEDSSSDHGDNFEESTVVDSDIDSENDVVESKVVDSDIDGGGNDNDNFEKSSEIDWDNDNLEENETFGSESDSNNLEAVNDKSSDENSIVGVNLVNNVKSKRNIDIKRKKLKNADKSSTKNKNTSINKLKSNLKTNKLKKKDKNSLKIPKSNVNSNKSEKLSAKTDFISANTFEELDSGWKSSKKLTLSERLANEENNTDFTVKEGTSGNREITFKLEGKKMKFEKLRDDQKTHHEKRKKVGRTTKRLKYIR